MADRAIELLNELLKIYNTESGEYLNLVGDKTRYSIKLEGAHPKNTGEVEFGIIRISGTTLVNTDNYKIYWRYNKAGSIINFFGYKDAAKTQQVLQGSITGLGTMTLTQVGGSGLSGELEVNVIAGGGLNSVNQIIFLKDLTITTEPIKINDINTGALSNSLEYLRQTNQHYALQLDLRYAKSTWLDFIAGVYYNLPRIAGESDSDYQTRTINTTMAIKVTPMAIRVMLEDYGDNVTIVEAIGGGAYADVSYADNTREFKISGSDIVKSAIATTFELRFNFRAIMENVTNTDEARRLITMLVENYKAGGISYSVEIS